MFGNKALSPNDVFTPRAASVNEVMYVPRPDLEERLRIAISGTLHVVVHGESGTGKSWLYKKVLSDLSAEFLVANLANASRFGSISKELENVVARGGAPFQTAYTESKNAEVGIPIAKGGLSHEKSYDVPQKEPFELCIETLRKRAGKRDAALVLDNLEAAFEEKLLKELADLIVLLDDERYAQHKVKIIIVGVPSDLRSYYFKTPHRETVANRLQELPEVSRLTEEQCRDLIDRGFHGQLEYRTGDDFDQIIKHVAWVTDRVPQKIHEYCLELALAGEDTRSVSATMLETADRKWLSRSLYNAYSAVEALMNERETKIGRRNQVLYALGLVEKNDFRYSDIEMIVRREFPDSTTSKQLNIAGLLTGLVDSDPAIIKRSPKGDAYVFRNTIYRMCLRAMLRKRGGPGAEGVERIDVAALDKDL